MRDFYLSSGFLFQTQFVATECCYWTNTWNGSCRNEKKFKEKVILDGFSYGFVHNPLRLIKGTKDFVTRTYNNYEA